MDSCLTVPFDSLLAFPVVALPFDSRLPTTASPPASPFTSLLLFPLESLLTSPFDSLLTSFPFISVLASFEFLLVSFEFEFEFLLASPEFESLLTSPLDSLLPLPPTLP